MPQAVDTELTAKAQARDLLLEVADRLYDATSTWRGRLGEDLAYLFVAIARGGQVAVTELTETAQLLKATFPPGHPIWRHVDLEMPL